MKESEVVIILIPYRFNQRSMTRKIFHPTSIIYWLMLVFSMLIFSTSCKPKNEHSVGEKENKFTSEILDTTFKRHVDFLQSHFGLTSAYTSKGEFLRFWGGSKPMDTCILINIESHPNDTTGEMYLFKYSVAPNGQPATVYYRKKIAIKETSWGMLFNKLKKSQIMTLPDFSIIPNYQMSNHDAGFTVEVFNGKMYRLYHYPDLWLNKEKKEVIQFEKIISILENELQVNLD
jgi:hypothetical protein